MIKYLLQFLLVALSTLIILAIDILMYIAVSALALTIIDFVCNTHFTTFENIASISIGVFIINIISEIIRNKKFRI